MATLPKIPTKKSTSTQTFEYDGPGSLNECRSPDDKYQHFDYDSCNRSSHAYWNEAAVLPDIVPNFVTPDTPSGTGE